MLERLKKPTATALCAILIALSPGALAAQELGAAERAAPAPTVSAPVLMAPVSAGLTLATLSAPALAPVLGLGLQAQELAPAAAPSFAAPAIDASGSEDTGEPAAAASAAAPDETPLPAAVPPQVARASRASGGLSRLVSAATATLGFGKAGVSSDERKAAAGRVFDGSAAASDLASAVVVSGEASRTRSRLLRGGRWLAVGALIAALAVHPAAAAGVLAKVSVPSYYFTNGAGCLFPLIQVREIFKRRSADVSSTTLLTGIAASLLLAVNFSYMGATFAAMQNLAGTLSFGIIAAQKLWYARRPALAGAPPASFSAVAAKTALSATAVAGLTYAIGKGLLAAVPTVKTVGNVLVPFQVLAGLGFAYLMLPEYLKIKRDKSVGDSSRGMARTYWACIVASGLWGLNKLVLIPRGPAAAHILPLAVFAAAAWPLSRVVVRWIAARSWSFVGDGFKIGKRTIGREYLVSAASFLLLAPFMLGLVAAGAGLFGLVMTVPAESRHQFAAYLFYVVGDIVAAVVTSETLGAFREYAPKKGPAQG